MRHATRNVTTFAKLQYHLGGASVLTPSLLKWVCVSRVVQVAVDEIQFMFNLLLAHCVLMSCLNLPSAVLPHLHFGALFGEALVEHGHRTTAIFNHREWMYIPWPITAIRHNEKVAQWPL